MGDSISVNNDVKILTRYAMGLTPEETPSTEITPGVIPTTITIEKICRNGSIFGKDLLKPKESYKKLVTLEQGLKGSTFTETAKNYAKNLDLTTLERNFQDIKPDFIKDFKKLETAKNIEALKIEAKTLTGKAKKDAIYKIAEATKNFKETYGYKDLKEASSALKDLSKQDLAQAAKTYEKNLFEYKKSGYFKKVRSLINEAKGLNGKEYAKKIKEINQAIADANVKLNLDIKKGKLRPVVKGFNKLKFTKADTLWKKAISKSPKLQTATKFCRSNAVTAVSLDLALGIPEIMQTYQAFEQFDENGNQVEKGKGTGTSKALKHTARIAATGAAQVGAYVVGAKAGAAIGASIGSVFPGVGNIVGGILGAAIGFGASYLAGKGMNKVLGKTDLDKLTDLQANQITATVQSNPENMITVLQKAQDSEDPVVKKAYENTIEAAKNGEFDPEEPAQTQIEQGNTSTPVTANPEPTTPPKKDNTSNAHISQTKPQMTAKEYNELIKELDEAIAFFDNLTFGGSSFQNNMNMQFQMPQDMYIGTNNQFGYGFDYLS